MSETLRWREPQVLPEERAIFSFAAMSHEVKVVPASTSEPIERLEARILRAALDRGDGRLRDAGLLGESALRQASPGSSRAEQFTGAHADNDNTIRPAEGAGQYLDPEERGDREGRERGGLLERVSATVA